MDFEHFLVLTKKVINQTQRRVIDEERVPAEEKVVSIFEEHTDIIRKDRRETLYGHKVCMTGGSSSMILDCVILDGNPSDSTLAETMIRPSSRTLRTGPAPGCLRWRVFFKGKLGSHQRQGS